MATDISKLEAELKNLSKQRGNLEHRLKIIERKERGSNQTKRTRTDEEVSNNNEKEDSTNKRSRISSVVSGDRIRDRDESRNSYQERSRGRNERNQSNRDNRRDNNNRRNQPEDTQTTARPQREVKNPEDANRHKRVFGMLMGTLQRFKTDLDTKSETLSKRSQIEKQVETKVNEERETFLSQHMQQLKEEKEKDLALRDELKKKEEELETQILNAKWQKQKEELSRFMKTETKPHIFYRPNAKYFEDHPELKHMIEPPPATATTQEENGNSKKSSKRSHRNDDSGSSDDEEERETTTTTASNDKKEEGEY